VLLQNVQGDPLALFSIAWAHVQHDSTELLPVSGQCGLAASSGNHQDGGCPHVAIQLPQSAA
jgi:hypothetical protein